MGWGRCKETAGRLIHGVAAVGRAVLGVDRASLTRINERLATCRTCEHYIRQKSHQRGMERCGLCGCLIRVKARLNAEKCPAGKW